MGAIANALRAELPPESVIDEGGVVASYRRDMSRLTESGQAAVVVRASSADDVVTVIRVANELGTPVVARGAGTGLAGAANAIDGCVVLIMTGMDEIDRIDATNLTATVQPGVINSNLASAAAELGLWYPPDPASRDISTIGGNIATNAGGLCCVKYGVTGDYVLSLEVVLADGSMATMGHPTVKDVAGYDLVSLLVGSEGTLGVVTKATMRLLPKQATPTTLVASFESLESVGRAISRIVRRVRPAMLEVLDTVTLTAIEEFRPMGLETSGCLLVAQSDGVGGAADRELEAMTAACRESGSSYTAQSSSPQEANMMLEARRLAFPALEAHGMTLLDDVAVPLGSISELITRIHSISSKYGLTIGTFGHAGDGNLHPTIVYESAQRARAKEAFDELVAAAVALGGTVTGEHGVGVLKRPHLRANIDPAVRALQTRIKRAFDPNGILNPARAIA